MSSFVPGLRPSLKQPAFRRLSLAAAGYRPPPHIDLRFEMLPASDQGNTSQCAAYSMAGWIEHYRWKRHGICEQIDPEPIYARAKKIDGDNQAGTSLYSVLQAAQDLGHLSAIAQESIREVTSADEAREALHRHGVLLAGFHITEGWSKAGKDGWIEQGGAALGGHAVVLVGYSLVEEPNYFSLQNSWGDLRHGWRGFCRLHAGQFEQEFMYGLVWPA